MFIYQVLAFLIIILGLLLAIWVFSADRKSKINRIFSLFTLSFLLWAPLPYFFNLSSLSSVALYLVRFGYGTVSIFLVAFYFLATYFPRIEKRYPILEKTALIIGIGFAFISIFTNIIVENVEITKWGVNPLFGIGKIPYFGSVFFLALISMGLLFKKYFSLSKEEKLKIQYVFIGLILFVIPNIIFNVIFPFIGRTSQVQYYPFGNYSAIFLLGFTAYAIVKRELFNIRVVLTALLVSSIAILLGLDIFVFTTELMFQLYKGLVLVAFIYFGYLLIRSVLKEIEMRERIKKAYDIEKKARKQIEELTEAKTQFIMATQHHLRTPLTSMIGFLDLLFGGTYGKIPAKIKQSLLKFESSTKRLMRVVNELLDISQFQLGKEVVSLNPGTDLSLILKEVIEELQFEVEYRDLYLKFQKIGKIPKIKADSEKLKVGLFNIVDNAIKYTRKGGVTVVLQKVGANVRISIKDTGIGLDPEKAKTLFKSAFVRGKEAKKVHGFGRGIGVYITGHIIKAHHGKIWAESEGENKGSTFFIDLPVG